MTKPLITTSLAAPAFYGLNTQDSEVTLDKNFARNAENCIIDEGGRLGAREGWEYIATASGVGDFKGLHRFVDVAGIEYFGCWTDDNYFYIYDGTTTLQAVTYSGSQGDILSHTAGKGNWQAVSLFDAAYLVQEGFEPLYFDPLAGTLDDISNSPSYSATAAGVPYANTVLAAYGRLWIADSASNKTTIWWSDLLSGEKWNSGTAGYLDISTVLQHGNDEIVGLGAHNGYLIVFCKDNIIIFADSDAAQSYLDPTTLQLVEVISGVGCIARDSIQNTGTDIVFLSRSGLRSIGRTIQEKSQPFSDLSKNVRDTLVNAINNEQLKNIKSCYSEHNAFYLLAFPTAQTVYCFDTRSLLPDGAARVTRWNGLSHSAWLGFEDKVYMTSPNGIAQYRGYQDNGSKYTMQYYTNYFNFDMPNQIKILKNIATTVIGSTGQKFVIKVATDYEDIYTSFPYSLKEGTVFEYNECNYGLTTTTSAASQAADTITVVYNNGSGDVTEHYTVDFQDYSDDTYNNTLKVWLDADGYYYAQDDGTRSRVTLYVKNEDFASKYSGATLIENIRVPAGGSGFVVQLGFESTIDGGFFNIQQVDLYVKQGRLN